MATMLEKIIDYKKLETEHRRRKVSLKDYEKMAADQDVARVFLPRFTPGQINIIAEIKRASPSAGDIRQEIDPIGVAKCYDEGGASAISVLTDEHFFKGSLDDLVAVRSSVSLPVLRKDFTVSEYNIWEARAHGADVILLIVAALDDAELKDFYDMATELGMTVLTEIHDRIECDRILTKNFNVIGINNRNLKTFKTDIKVTHELLDVKALHERLVVSESGLGSHEQLADLVSSGVGGFLIGETLMRANDPVQKLRQLRGVNS